jgi:hypothetical protein
VNQEIRFCTCPNGARIAYALSGRGAPLVMSGGNCTGSEKGESRCRLRLRIACGQQRRTGCTPEGGFTRGGAVRQAIALLLL